MNPTLTIAALSLRLADHIDETLRSLGVPDFSEEPL